MHFTEEEIVRKVLAGEKHCFAEIVARYQGPVYNLMYRYTRHEQDAADLTQEVFLQAFDRLSTYRSGHSLFSWLYTLAINKANDWHRSRNRRHTGMQAAIQENALARETNSPTAGLETREKEQQVQEALNQLPPETREILLLRYQHDQSVRGVAEVFGISESAAKMRVKRGLAQLQEILLETQDNGFKSF